MANDKAVIRSLFGPSIKLDDMVLEDLFKGTSPQLESKGEKTGRQYQNTLGTDYPFIIVNGYVFSVAEIINFEIDANGFLPYIDLTISMSNTAGFKTTRFPKDGDIISVFIRAKNDAFKPIRNDYLITYVDSGPGSSEGRGSTITLRGSLFIPHMDDEVIKSFEGTSVDVLQKICKELKLGFATNEDTTDDSQIWICPGDTLRNTITSIVDHAYKDEKSFFKCFIDVFYHLNFVNVNTQVASEGKMSAAILDIVFMKDDKPDMALEKSSQREVKKFLCDMDNFKDTNMFIETYTVQNNSSDISKRWGYKTFAQFYDQQTQDTWSLYVDPIVTDGANDTAILLKGRPYPKAADGTAEEKYWEKQNKYVWLGVQSKNVHDMYLYSEIWNRRNLEELDKLYLEAHVTRWNPNIYRGEKIPILLHSFGDINDRVANRTPNDANLPTNETAPTANQFYSGYYMVDGIKLMYTISKTDTSSSPPPEGTPGMTQVFLLRRREWPIPATG